jgi:hypothetical protein
MARRQREKADPLIITDEQPVINLYGYGGTEPPEMPTLYHTISRCLAIVLSEVERGARGLD